MSDLLVNGRHIHPRLVRLPDQDVVAIGERQFQVTRLDNDRVRLTAGDHSYIAVVVRTRDRWLVEIDSYQIEVLDAAVTSTASGGGDHGGVKDKIFAPMPGKIVKVLVAVGDKVQDKQPVVIVEAMKMENQVTARTAGVVRAIHFTAGDQVDTERPIIELDLQVG